ncbi:MAG: ribulose-phosphate 3-epimerase, partial [Candidatus Omnitrophota bacterium]
GPTVIRSIRKVTDLFFDVHLMIDKPERYVEEFAEAGSDLITFHIEACDSPEDMIKLIKQNGKKAGVSVKPGTKLSSIDKILKEVDLVLIMTVEPGFGGQSFMKEQMEKVKELKKRFAGYIEVDGGINKNTSGEAISAGANVLVAGTAVFGQKDYARAIREIRGKQ